MEKIIFIDVTEPGKLIFILDDGSVQSREEKRGELLNFLLCLTSFLKKKSLDLRDLKALVLLEGAGSFSTVRQAAAVLNVLHLGAGVKILGLDKKKFEIDKNFFQKVRQMVKNKKVDFLKPIYGGEPHITMPRRR